MSEVVLSNKVWRQYEGELVNEFLGPNFDPTRPPTVATLLERDNISPQPYEDVRKVDRYAPAAAAAATVSGTILVGHEADTHLVDLVRHPKGATHTVFDRIGMDVRGTWIDAADRLKSDSTSRFNDYLAIYEYRTFGIKPLPRGRVIATSHIASGGQLAAEIGGFLRVLSETVGHKRDRDERQTLCHALVPVETARAGVHIAKSDSATPPWMRITRVQLHDSERAIPTLKSAKGERLWQGGRRTSGEETPLLMCPVQTHGSLKDIVHGSINEAFDRQAL